MHHTGRAGRRARQVYDLRLECFEIEALGDAEADIAHPGEASRQRLLLLPSLPAPFTEQSPLRTTYFCDISSLS